MFKDTSSADRANLRFVRSASERIHADLGVGRTRSESQEELKPLFDLRAFGGRNVAGGHLQNHGGEKRGDESEVTDLGFPSQGESPRFRPPTWGLPTSLHRRKRRNYIRIYDRRSCCLFGSRDRRP